MIHQIVGLFAMKRNTFEDLTRNRPQRKPHSLIPSPGMDAQETKGFPTKMQAIRRLFAYSRIRANVVSAHT